MESEDSEGAPVKVTMASDRTLTISVTCKLVTGP